MGYLARGFLVTTLAELKNGRDSRSGDFTKLKGVTA
jgi:hypothetical protein